MKTFSLITSLFLLCNLASGQVQNDYYECLTESRNIKDFCFSGTGATVFAADNLNVTIINSSTGGFIRSIKTLHTAELTAIRISQDSTVLCTGGKDGLLVINKFETNEVEAINDGNGYITSLAISSNSSYLAAGYSSGDIRVYNLIELKLLYSIKNEFTLITDIEFSPDCSQLAIAGAGPNVLLVNAQTGEIFSKLSGHKSWSRDVTFNNSGNLLMSCGDDGKLNIYLVENPLKPRLAISRKQSMKWIIGGAFLKDNKSFVYSSVQGLITTETSFITETKKLKATIYKIDVMPRADDYIRIAVSAEGKGLLFLNPLNFTLK